MENTVSTEIKSLFKSVTKTVHWAALEGLQTYRIFSPRRFFCESSRPFGFPDLFIETNLSKIQAPKWAFHECLGETGIADTTVEVKDLKGGQEGRQSNF